MVMFNISYEQKTSSQNYSQLPSKNEQLTLLVFAWYTLVKEVQTIITSNIVT